MVDVTANSTSSGDSLETLRENLNLLRSDLSGFAAPTLTGSTNNTITTVTGSDAIQGEANLTFDGSTLTVTGAAVTGAITASGLITANSNIVIANDGNIGSAGDTDAISIDSSGNVTISQNLTVSGTQTIVDTITMNAANAIVFEGATADAHETTLSIVDPTGDHTQYLINQGGYVPLLAAVTTTAITSTPAELNLLDGSSANSVVNSKAVIYGSSGEVAGTLSTAAQANITSLGTLTTLTVDSIIINGTNIGHTSDTDSIAIASNGVVTFSQAPVFPDGSIDLDDLDIDGATDIGAGLADADLFIVDDAAGGTNRKSAASRIKTYIADVTLTTAAQTNITSLGTLTTLTVDSIIINGANIGHTSDTDSIAIASDGVVTFSQAPVFPDGSIAIADLDIDGGTDINADIVDADLFIIDDGAGGTNRKTAASRLKTYIGSTAADDLATGDAAVTLTTSSGNITIDAAANNSDIIFKGTDATSDITMLTLDGSEAGAATFNAGIILPDDGTIGGASATSAMTIDSNGIVAFVDDIKIKDGGTIGVASTVNAMTISSAGIVTFVDDIVIKDAGTIGSASAAGAIAIASDGIVTFVDDIIIKNGGTIGSASDADSIAIASDGVVTFSQAPVFPDGSIAIADLDIDGAADIGANIADADLFIIDDGAGGTNRKTTASRLKTYIGAGAADDLTAGDAAVTLTTSSGNITIDAAANNSDIIFKGTDATSDITMLTLDGSEAGVAIFNAGIVIADAGNIGSASDADAIAIASDGVVTMNQIPVFSAGINVSGGTIAGTLATVAQGNITSLGTLTTLTVDNIIINGTNIGHTSDTDSIAIASDGVVTFSQAPVFPDGSIDLVDLDIDGATDIGAGIADADLFIVDDGAGGTNRKVTASRFKTYIGSTSGALDDLTVGDAASTLATSAGNITIDAQGDNTDIIFKGTDATADITMLTLDGSEAGTATFNSGILLPDDGTIGSASATSAMTIDSNGIVAFVDDIKIKDGGTIGVASAATAMTISSGGIVTFVDDILIKDGGTIGSASAATAITVASTGIVTFVDDILIKNGGTIGSAGDADSIAIASDGVVTFSQVPVFPNDTVETADIQDNAVTLAKMAGGTDGNIISFDASGDPVAIATGNDGQVLTSTGAGSPPAFEDVVASSVAADNVATGDAAVTITTSSGNITIDAAANDSDIIFKGTDATADITMLTLDGSEAGVAIFNAGIVIADAGTIGSASDTDAIAIGSDGDVTLTQDLELQHDGAILSFGANDEVSLTHVHDTGLLFNSTMALQFNDASQYINAPSATILDINATDEIELNATLVDVNANLDVSGTYQGGGLMTTGGNIVIPDLGNIGSASTTDAIEISVGGMCTFSGTHPRFEGTGNVYQSSGEYYLGRDAAGNYTSTENDGFISYYDAASYVWMRAQDGTTGAAVWRMVRNSVIKSEIEENGDYQSATNSYGATSDERLKEHIIDSGSQWNDIKALRIRKYSFIEDKTESPKHLGVIAQELESTGMHGLVKTHADVDSDDNPKLDSDGDKILMENGDNIVLDASAAGTDVGENFLLDNHHYNYKSVKYSVLYMKAVKALQEAMTRIETLETKVAVLESA